MNEKKIAVTGGTKAMADAAIKKAEDVYSKLGYCVMREQEAGESGDEKVLVLSDGKCGSRDSYDAVFFMETPFPADDRNQLQAWIGNPHLRVIGYSDKAEEQLDSLISEISFFLGEPEPVEIERKYLIEYPDIRLLEGDPMCRRVEISQTYLEDEEGGYRVRKRGEEGRYLYYLTRKKKISDITRIETEERITEEEYLEHLNRGKKPLKTVSKSRYCLLYKNRYFEVDVFPFWKDRALMEIELTSEDEEAELPPQIKVIREVSCEKEYTNRSIAERLAAQR